MTGQAERLALSPANAPWDIASIAAGLKAARQDWRAAQGRGDRDDVAGFPSRAVLDEIMVALAGALFPRRLGPAFVHARNEDAFVVETLDAALRRLLGQLRLETGIDPDAAAEIAGRFAASLPALRRQLDEDVYAAFAGDPAARSVDEVLLCYPGIPAILHHRLAHRLHRLGAPLVARIVAEIAHSATGIDIHPGATIGRAFFIDHGNGVVIGETAVIGDRVRIYQAVTLGARSFPAEADGSLAKGLPRHPVVEDDVVIYAGATILGRVTIGAGSVIGGNVWLTESVPRGSVVHQAHVERAAIRPGGAR